MKRPKIDESLCFICQDTNAFGKPTWKAIKGNMIFLLCDTCKSVVEDQNRQMRAIQQALIYPEHGKKIFQETLGMSITVPEIIFQKL